jgi:type I restriction enzyme, S subunit
MAVSQEAKEVRDVAVAYASPVKKSGVPKGYKLTEVGMIPEDWEVTSLGSGLSARPDYGINAPAVPYSDRLPAYIRITDITDDGHYDLSTPVSVKSTDSEKYYLEVGDIVLARTGASVGKSYLYMPSDGRLVFAGFLIRVHPDSVNLHAAYVAAYLSTGPYWRWVQQMSMRSGQPGINGNEYALMPLPKPPINEQRAIATALSDVDALLEGLDRLIAKKRDLKQAAMQQLLTGQTRLPGFEGEWEVKRLGEHVTFLRNGVNSRAELTIDDPVKYLHYGDIHACSGASISPKDLPSLPTEKAKTLGRLADGDLIFADASEDLAGIGKSVEIRDTGDTEVVSGLHTIAARFDKNILADGFKAYLQFCPAFIRHLRRLAAGTKVYATNRAHIATVEMALPSVEEQVAIASVFRDMDAELDALQQRRAKTAALKQAMMQELLTGRTRLI